MKTFKQHITELWDKPLPYRKNKGARAVKRNTGLYEYEFVVKLPKDKIIYRVKMVQTGTTWIVTFDSGGEEMDITGAAGEKSVQVFSTVYAIIKDWVKEVEPESVEFSADKRWGESRAKLYDRMVKSMAPKNYTVTVATSSGWTHDYLFRKK